jgi:hypothetical protein
MIGGFRPLRSGLQLLALLLCLFIPHTGGLWADFSDLPGPPADSVTFEPPATIPAFISASLTGDKATLGQVSSSVYWLELRRRGVNISQEDSDTVVKTLSYVAVGGARDEYGYGHWLYSTFARSQRGDQLLTIWRFDTDPSNLVLWAEPGVLLANTCGRLIRDAAPRTIAIFGGQEKPATLVLSARCPESSHGYYILRAAGRPSFTFASIHEDGETYMANWTFGHVLNSREAITGRGYFLVDGALKSPAEDAYRSYLRDLEQPVASLSDPGTEARGS